MLKKLIFLLIGLLLIILNANAVEPLFGPAAEYQVGAAQSIIAVDLDGDSDYDLAVTKSLFNTVGILINNGDGTFQSRNDYAIDSVAWIVAPADFDSDGDNDLAVTNNGSANVSVLMNNGDGTFQPAIDYIAADEDNLWSIVASDFNGDDAVDIALTKSGSYLSNIFVLFNNGDGSFQPPVSYGIGDNPYSLCTDDFDNDGDYDLAAIHFTVDPDNISILINNGDGTFAPVVNYHANYVPISIYSEDFNNDNNPDLAVANFGSHDISILLNNNDGTFQSAINYGTGNVPACVFSADLNGDGFNDLITACQDNDNVTVLLNSGDGTFGPPVCFDVGPSPEALYAADLDGDNDVDVVTADLNHTSVLLNLSNFLCGDANNSGGVDILDITYIISFLYKGGDEPLPHEACDVDNNGAINLLDITYLIAYLYKGGAEPVCP